MGASKYCKDCIRYREESDEQDGVTERICMRDGWQTAPYLSCPFHEGEDKYTKRVTNKTDETQKDVMEELRQ